MLVYACAFVLANVIYFPCSEEPALVKRYGDEYQRYLNNVPRWIPRTKPYYFRTVNGIEKRQLVAQLTPVPVEPPARGRLAM